MGQLQSTDNPTKALSVGVKQAAEMLGICQRTLHTLKGDGKIRYFRIGSKIMFSIPAIKRFIKQQEEHQRQQHEENNRKGE